jgi:hypothetical protein
MIGDRPLPAQGGSQIARPVDRPVTVCRVDSRTGSDCIIPRRWVRQNQRVASDDPVENP